MQKLTVNFIYAKKSFQLFNFNAKMFMNTKKLIESVTVESLMCCFLCSVMSKILIKITFKHFVASSLKLFSSCSWWPWLIHTGELTSLKRITFSDTFNLKLPTFLFSFFSLCTLDDRLIIKCHLIYVEWFVIGSTTNEVNVTIK